MKKGEDLSLLINHFNDIIPLSEEEISALHNIVFFQHFKRKNYLLQEGNMVRYYNFILVGMVKLFYVDENEKEHNLMFSPENDWVINMRSAFDALPSDLEIVAMEPTVVARFTFEDIAELCDNYPNFEKRFRVIANKKLFYFQKMYTYQIVLDAKERYLHFMEDNPKLKGRVSDAQIASMLGITTVFMSKIKKQLTEEGLL